MSIPMLRALQERHPAPEAIAQAAAEAQRSGRTVQDVLLDDQIATDVEIAEAYAQAYGLTTVDLAEYRIDSAAMALLPVALSRRHRVLALAVDGDELVVAVNDPGDVLAIDDIRAATGMAVRLVVAPRDELLKALDRFQRDEHDLGDLAAEVSEDAHPMIAALAPGGDDAPIVRYVNSLIEQAIDNRASDVHLEPAEKELRIRFRIDGVLHEVDTVPQAVQSALISRIKIMSNLDITDRRLPQNGRMTVQLGARQIDLRSATLPTVWGEKVVLRVLDTGGVDLELSKLGFSPRNFERYSSSFRKPHGMVLVTGPTGSGKSTTLYATLMEISTPEVNIITIEDPVEYRLPGVNQVQVNTKAGLTFAAVLPAILRSDPDVVLIGEIRDRATAQLCVEAALTGHLVLSTLHTNDAPSAMSRLIEMGVEPYLVGSSIDCVLAQRLGRRLCDWCKQPYEPTESELDAARWPTRILPAPERLWRPAGCRSCANTGYRGRLAMHEVMPVGEELERMSAERASAHALRRVAIADGMTELAVDGLTKAAAGLTSVAEVLRVAGAGRSEMVTE